MAIIIRSTDETLDGTIATYSGATIKPLDPDPNAIHLEDIAHALSNSCRFTGHVKEFYSVAQHSVLAARLILDKYDNDTTLAKVALLHDASEAYLSDIARPIKQVPEFGTVYKKFEAKLEEAIAMRFDTEYPMPDEVKWADNVLLRTEQRDLMPAVFRHAGEDYLDETITGWLPNKAEAEFLKLFNELEGIETEPLNDGSYTF
ncbi:MAG TPA: metal-dependent phosphohydrolase [Candidatus Paceibacterota bacterium]